MSMEFGACFGGKRACRGLFWSPWQRLWLPRGSWGAFPSIQSYAGVPLKICLQTARRALERLPRGSVSHGKHFRLFGNVFQKDLGTFYRIPVIKTFGGRFGLLWVLSQALFDPCPEFTFFVRKQNFFSFVYGLWHMLCGNKHSFPFA